MSDSTSAQIHLHGSTFSVVLHAPVADLPAYQTLLETAVCAFASARDPTSPSRDSDSLQVASNELGTQVSLLHVRAGEGLLTSVLYSWLWSCLRAERRYSQEQKTDLNTYRTRTREGWPREVLFGLARTIRLRRDDVRALKDVATFAVEVLRILRSSTPPPSYADATSELQTQPPKYSRWSHPRWSNVSCGQHLATHPTAVAPSLLPPTASRTSYNRRTPFDHSVSVLQKRLLHPRLRASPGSRPLGATAMGPVPRLHTPGTRREEQDSLVHRSRRTYVLAPSPLSPSRTSSLLTTDTTSSARLPLLASYSPLSPPAPQSTAAAQPDAHLAFEQWLDAPRCPTAIPEWHFQPAEGEADWLTEMLL